MALKVLAKARLTVSQDNAPNPQEITFDSGDKSATDTTTYSESVSHTFNVEAGATDVQVDLGSLAEVDFLYLFAKASGLTIKLVPVGKTVADVSAYEILQNTPCVIPFKIKEIYVSNPGASDAVIVLGAAGN
jgi:hypothetical protein